MKVARVWITVVTGLVMAAGLGGSLPLLADTQPRQYIVVEKPTTNQTPEPFLVIYATPKAMPNPTPTAGMMTN
jgi:hypothetical protein